MKDFNDWESAPIVEVSAEEMQEENKKVFLLAYNKCNGVHESIAKILGISVRTVKQKIKEYGL